MAKETSHGETARGWQGSHLSHGEKTSVQWIVMESTHGETASVQRIVRILVLTSDGTCSGAANPLASVLRQSEGGTG